MDTFLEWLHEKRHDPKHVRVSGGDVAPNFGDIIELLHRHSTPELPLVDLFVLSPDCQDCAATPEESSRMSFGDWLLEEERSLVDPHVLDGYERLFQQQLEALIQRTRDPALRQAFEKMRFCPVQDRNGRCCRSSITCLAR